MNTTTTHSMPLADNDSPAVFPPSTVRRWTGRILSGLAVLFMLADGAFKFARPLPQPVADSFRELGYDPAVAPVIGSLSIISALVYAIPRTAVIGAVLLTGYFGGAIATHLRLGHPLFSHVLFPVYFAVLVWGGLYLRDNRLKALLAQPKRC